MRTVQFLLLIFVLAIGSVNQAANAQPLRNPPVLRIINFTADWCPNCRIMNPKIEEAMTQIPDGEVERVDLDMSTAGRGASEGDRITAWNNAIRLADTYQAAYLWDWYGGVTGIAVIISADNGEPISCLNRTFATEDIVSRLNEAKLISLRRPAGSRMPDGADCPPPLR